MITTYRCKLVVNALQLVALVDTTGFWITEACSNLDLIKIKYNASKRSRKKGGNVTGQTRPSKAIE